MSTSGTINQLEEGMYILMMRGDDRLHQVSLRRFLIQEATSFGTKIHEEGFKNLLDTVTKGRVQVLFAIVQNEIAGCAVQFPTAYPIWDKKSQSFNIFPAVYSEDMAISEQASKEFRDQYLVGAGTTFMKGRVKLAADSNDSGSYDLASDFPAGAIVGEQSWPEGTPVGGMLGKFGTVMAQSHDDSVLVLNKFRATETEILESSAVINNLWMPVADANMQKIDRIFSITWRGAQDQQIAATFTLAVSTFTGDDVVRVYFAKNDVPASEASIEQGLKEILIKGTNEAVKLGWIDKENPYQSLRMHALGEQNVRRSLRLLGSENRELGDFVMHPLFMDFGNIPGNMGLTLPQPEPFVSLPKVKRNTKPPPTNGNGGNGDPSHSKGDVEARDHGGEQPIRTSMIRGIAMHMQRVGRLGNEGLAVSLA